MYIHTDERLGHPPPTPLVSKYLKWMQRSLNLRGECLQVDGLDSPAYREAVKRFQSSVSGLTPNGKVDAPTQDALILSNQGNPIYIDWVQTALVIPKTAKLDPNAIREFQALARSVDPNLKLDGVVGPKTEALIVRFSFTLPPGSSCPVVKEEPVPKSAFCKEVNKLTLPICDAAQQICEIAAQGNDEWSRAKCAENRARCWAARKRSFAACGFPPGG
jgi:hypothetical protein